MDSIGILIQEKNRIMRVVCASDCNSLAYKAGLKRVYQIDKELKEFRKAIQITKAADGTIQWLKDNQPI